MDWTALIWGIGLDLLLTIIVCFLVPVIVLLTGKKFKAKTIKRIAVLNCISCWLLYQIVMLSADLEPSTGFAAFVWGGIGYTIMKKRCLKEPTEEKGTTPSDESDAAAQDAMRSLSGGDKTPRTYGSYNVPATELRLETAQETIPHPDTLSSIEDNSPQIERATEKTARYCSKCGSAIDSKTKKCTGCGKQYFKGIPWKPVCNIAVALLLVASFVGNALLFKEKAALVKENTILGDTITELEKSKTVLNTRIDQLQETRSSLQKKNTSLEQELRIAENDIALYNKYVALVVDDGTRLYHKYGCDVLDKADSYWCYGYSDSTFKQYKPCPLCYGD